MSTIPWIEKYRPETLDDVIHHDHIIGTLKKFIKDKTLPHLLLYGPPGTGKTSTILSCMKELYGKQCELMVIEINASEERGIEVVRTRINQFVNTKNIYCPDNNMFKMVILDEADAMTSDAQAILRRTIEKYTKNVRFCLICNYIKKINIALQSRCTLFRFSSLNKKSIKQNISKVIDAEKINITEKGIDTIINRSNGDMRKVLNILQAVSISTNKISEIDVNKCLCYPINKHSKQIYDSLMNDNFENSNKLIFKLVVENGYSLGDIIIEMHDKLYSSIMDDIYSTRISKILELLRDIEYNLSLCTDDTLQISAMVGVFKLSKCENVNIDRLC
jgi:replication factor C subunit 3/5